MGHVFSVEDALVYRDWAQSDSGRAALEIEKELLLRIWSPRLSQSVLEVGCGTGVFLEWFSNQGHQVTGLDPSCDALALARSVSPGRVSLDRGFGEDLPYPNNTFDTVALINTLEFVDNPVETLKEACRVARKNVLIGTLNRYSLVTWQRYMECWWKPSYFRHARTFSIPGLHHLIESVLAGRVPIQWKTCLALPRCTLRYLRFLERSKYFQWNPFGHFIGLRVDLQYPLRTIQEPLLTKVTALSGAGPGRCHVTIRSSSRKNAEKFPDRDRIPESGRGCGYGDRRMGVTAPQSLSVCDGL